MVFTMASVGLPGTSGFVGEFLALVGAYEINSWVAAVATTGIILGAGYMLWLYWRVAYGAARTAEAAAMPDLSRRELAMLAPIAAAVLWMGVYPESFIAPMRQDVTWLLAADRARSAAGRRRCNRRQAAGRGSARGGRGGALMRIPSSRHPSESWDLTAFAASEKNNEIPAFAGMTMAGDAGMTGIGGLRT